MSVAYAHNVYYLSENPPKMEHTPAAASDVSASKNDWIATDGHQVHQASGPDDNNRVIRFLSDDIGRDKLEAAVAQPDRCRAHLVAERGRPDWR